MHPSTKRLEQAFRLARERYASLNVSVDKALARLARIPISIHCWQGDDIGGFESLKRELGGGLAVTGHYPGKARTARELRDDLDRALSLIPGRHRLNLHAVYGEFGGLRVDRNEIEPGHFKDWIGWARTRGLGLDFNPTYFAHPKAADGFTLSHRDQAIRRFWIEHGLRCREIGAAFGKSLGSPCLTNTWIPDGYKDTPADRRGPRERLVESLDSIFKKPIPAKLNLDAVEPKLFGIGSESYVVGSHEFYLGYAITRKKLLCLDAGHFHPTESISDKITSVLQFVPRILLHVSRGIRWDSDHVVTFTDDLQAIAREIIVNNYLDRVHIGLDFFDASINRIAAWVIGAHNMLRALLVALLEPTDELRRLEREGDLTGRIALMEELKLMPSGAVWDYYCHTKDVPVAEAWITEARSYEREVLSKREPTSSI